MNALLAAIALCIALLTFAPRPAKADSGQIVAKQNVADICNAPAITHRKTIVYVDLSAIKKDQREWGLTILNRLELAPREWLTVLGVNPNTFEISEVFDSCYPALTKQELDSSRSKRGWLDSLTQMDPEGQQRENIQAFETRLTNALDKLVDIAGKYSPGKRRDILGALAVDKNRFEDRRSVYRLVIYTDGTIEEPTVAKTGGKDQFVRSLTEHYATGFSGADIYVYGAIGSDAGQPLETRAQIFSGYFLNSWGWLRSFAPSLPQQDHALYKPLTRMNGSFSGGGAEGTAKLTFALDDTNAASEVWLSFVVGANTLFIPLKGDYACKDESCTLTATAIENIPFGVPTPYFRKGDKLSLVGTSGGEFTGKLQPASPEVFKDAGGGAEIGPKGTKQVEYSLRLAAQ